MILELAWNDVQHPNAKIDKQRAANKINETSDFFHIFLLRCRPLFFMAFFFLFILDIAFYSGALLQWQIIVDSSNSDALS